MCSISSSSVRDDEKVEPRYRNRSATTKWTPSSGARGKWSKWGVPSDSPAPPRLLQSNSALSQLQLPDASEHDVVHPAASEEGTLVLLAMLAESVRTQQLQIISQQVMLESLVRRGGLDPPSTCTGSLIGFSSTVSSVFNPSSRSGSCPRLLLDPERALARLGI
ncbi:hypothetical protein T492DRAFT_962427 [Pavlovales sp. CCMP2436]|nr:hypothetical protein T492DRAFT_962427 [Pavlovales sp. CCMP2436]